MPKNFEKNRKKGELIWQKRKADWVRVWRRCLPTTARTVELFHRWLSAKLNQTAGQPRRHFDEAALAELADSIRQYGVLQPLVVRPMESGGYQLVAGERRWRAARMAGLSQVPVVIRELSDSETMELALIENLQRE